MSDLQGALKKQGTTLQPGDVVLNAFAFVAMQVFLDLTVLVGRFINRNADFAIWAGERTREQAGVLPFDVEVPDLAEIEQAFVETKRSPFESASALL